MVIRMKLLRFVMFLFYRYYSTGGTRRIQYFSSISAVGFLIYLHILQLLIIIDKLNWFPMEESDTKLVKYGKMAFFFLPIFIIIALLVKEKDLRDAEYDEDKIRTGGRWLVVYIVFSFVLTFVLAAALAKKA